MASLTPQSSANQSVAAMRLAKRVAALNWRVDHLKKKIKDVGSDQKGFYEKELKMREAELAYKGMLAGEK